jgi:ferritin-like protein
MRDVCGVKLREQSATGEAHSPEQKGGRDGQGCTGDGRERGREEGIKEVAETAQIEDRNHFEALVPRIYELDGKLPDDMKVFHDISACPLARLPKNPRDVKAMLTVLVEAERCAVRGYTHIRYRTVGKDHRTYELSLAILNEKVEHGAWFSAFLDDGPSGRCLRIGGVVRVP